MPYSYQNPLAPVILYGPNGVLLDNNVGTNFNMYNIGGLMEVMFLSELEFNIPIGNTGTILFSGNVIPINYFVGVGANPNVLSLYNDGIGSGRRRLGMLVYVWETNCYYSYQIDNYETLFNNALAAGSIIDTGFGFACLDDTPAGLAFVSPWLDNSIEGVSGATKANARWRRMCDDIYVTGFTISGDTIYLNQNTDGPYSAFTISLSGISGSSASGISGISGKEGCCCKNYTLSTSSCTKTLLIRTSFGTPVTQS